MKKTFAFLLAMIMVFAVCGCRDTVEENSVLSWYEDGDSKGSKTNNSARTDSSSNSGTSGQGESKGNQNITDPLSANLKGATITIYSTGGNFSPKASESKTNKVAADNLKKLQSKLNCKLDVKDTTPEKLKGSVTTSAAAGKALCQIIDPTLYTSGYYIASGLVTDLSKVSSMDMSKDYMRRFGVADAMRFGNGTYAVCTEGYDRVYMVAFNKRILKEMGYAEDYIYKLVDAGNWTIDEYNKLSKAAVKDLDGKPGMSDADQYGQVMIDHETGISAALFANVGTSMIKIDSNGKLTYNMNDPLIVNTVTSIGEIARNGSRYLNDEWRSRVAFFASGKALFMWAPITNIPSIVNMKDDYGLVPSPKVSGSKDYTTAIDLNCRVLMVPAGLSAKDQANAGAFIQAYEYLFGDVIKANQSEYGNRYLRDTESLKFLKMASEQLKTDPSAAYGWYSEDILTGTYRVVWNYLNDSLKTPMAAAIESGKNAVMAALNDINKLAK